MENQKSSSPSRPLEELHVTFEDYKQLHLVGYFKVETNGDWLTIYKVHEDNTVFATLLYFRPRGCSWKEYIDVAEVCRDSGKKV